MIWHKRKSQFLVHEFNLKRLLPHIEQLKQSETEIWQAHNENNIIWIQEVANNRYESVKYHIDLLLEGWSKNINPTSTKEIDEILSLYSEVEEILRKQLNQFSKEKIVNDKETREKNLNKKNLPKEGKTRLYKTLEEIEEKINNSDSLIIRFIEDIEPEQNLNHE